MIKSLHLQNFRKVTDSYLEFTPGLNVLRGANEASKSTRLEAILYALFGTSALRTSLADTVTYGLPESALKVVLDFEFDGVAYTVTRGKSGAQIDYAGGVVTGQKETRLFVEKLFGCDADTAATLLFANQNEIRGILTSGPTAAGALVEQLAKLSDIENLIQKIQETLPYGSVLGIADQIKEAREMAEIELTEPSDTEVKRVEEIFQTCKGKLRDAEDKAERLDRLGVDARALLTRNNQVRKYNQDVTARQAELALIAHPGEPQYTPEQLDALEKAANFEAENGRRWIEYTKTFPKCDNAWEGTEAEFVTAWNDLKRKKTEMEEDKTKLEISKAIEASMLINEDVCSFCKKDLKGVPEVVQQNLETNTKIAALTEKIQARKVSLKRMADELFEYENLWNQSNRIKQVANNQYWTLTDTIPPAPTWVGEVPHSPKYSNYDLPLLRRNLKAYLSKLNDWQTAQYKLSELKLQMVEDETKAKLDLAAHLEACNEVGELARVFRAAESNWNNEKLKYAAAYGAFTANLKARDQAREQVCKLERLIADMTANNELVKKLRSVRPRIASKLWGTVLHAVSRYFSDIRGSSSVVSRDDAGFKVDGRSVQCLSGSTLDSLGLAIRLSLSRLFLPNVGFLFLDEPASGCDDNREVAMLATVAASGFPQTLLVTHSNLADALANNLIEL